LRCTTKVKAKLCRDNIPCLIVGTWDLNAQLFDGDVAAGLVPTLFAEDSDAAIKAINADPLKIHGDIQKINRLLFTPEGLSLKDAISLLKKPR